jgi:hypothetical protein
LLCCYSMRGRMNAKSVKNKFVHKKIKTQQE